MKKNTFELLIGFSVIIITILFLVSAISVAGKKHINGYNLFAKFDNIEGIAVGSDVKIGGVKVGEVLKQEIDKEDYSILLTLKIDENVKIPTDSFVKINTSGLIGGKFIKIEPGSEEENFKNNDRFEYTQSVIDLEDLIGRFLLKSGNDKK